MARASITNIAIFVFLVLVVVMFALALFGWLSGAWEKDPNNAYLDRSDDPVCAGCAR